MKLTKEKLKQIIREEFDFTSKIFQARNQPGYSEAMEGIRNKLRVRRGTNADRVRSQIEASVHSLIAAGDPDIEALRSIMGGVNDGELANIVRHEAELEFITY